MKSNAESRMCTFGFFTKKEFVLENRQILGYGEVVHLKTNAVKGLSQIIAIRELAKRDPTHPYTLDLNSDRIIVNANKEITQNIRVIQKNSMELEGLVNSTFAYAIFFHVIENMIADPLSFSSWRWFDAIVSKINKVREAQNLPEFDPEKFGADYSGLTLHDKVWELTSQLLTDNHGQLMLCAFENAGIYAGGR